MAYTANTAFEPRITNNEFDDLVNIAGLYRASGDAAYCDAGRLVVRDTLVPCEGFTGVNNENTWYMTDAVSTTGIDETVYACNTYDVQLLSAPSGALFAAGTETLGLGVPAGRYGCFTKIVFDGDHVYRWGEDNVTINTTGDTYFTIDDGALTSVTTKPSTAGTLYFTLRGTGNFTVGTSAGFGYYDLAACKVTA